MNWVFLCVPASFPLTDLITVNFCSSPKLPCFLHRTSATPILIYLIALHTAGPPVASDVPNVKAFLFQTIKDVLWAPIPKCVIFYLLKDGKNRTWKSPDCCLAACSWQQRNGEVLITTFCLSTSLRILFARDRNFLMTRLPVHPLRKDWITRRHKAECTVSKVPCGVQCNPLLDTAQESNWKTFFMEVVDRATQESFFVPLTHTKECGNSQLVAFTFFLGLRSSVWNLLWPKSGDLTWIPGFLKKWDANGIDGS